MCDENTNGNIELDLSEAETERLVLIYIDKHFSMITKEFFHDMIKDGTELKDAVHHAVMNEMINELLSEFVETETKEETETNVK